MMGDSFDWPENPQGLRCLDEAMRCRICGELYHVPVSLQCGHCYCSNCIREHIASRVDNKEPPLCPICRTSCDETHITPQLVVRDIVDHFAQIREYLLSAVMCKAGQSAHIPKEQACLENCDAKERKGAGSSSQATKKRSAETNPNECRAKVPKQKTCFSAPSIPSKLCFNVMSTKQVKAAVCSLGLRGDGKRSELEQRYQAFRRFAATSADAGKNLPYSVLVKAFNAQSSREAFARKMGPRKADNLGITNYSFKDLADEARAFMKQARQEATESRKTFVATGIDEQDQPVDLPDELSEDSAPEDHKVDLQKSQQADISGDNRHELKSELFREAQKDFSAENGNQGEVVVTASDVGSIDRNANHSEAMADSERAFPGAKNAYSAVMSEKNDGHKIGEASINENCIEERVDLTQSDPESIQMYTVVQQTFVDGLEDMLMPSVGGFDCDIVADSQTQSDSISIGDRV